MPPTKNPPQQQNEGQNGNKETTAYKTDWATSAARKQLKDDVLSGRIKDWLPKDVYFDPERHSLYKHYKRDNFTTNLNTLRKSIAKARTEAKRDMVAYEAYKQMHPIDETELRWHRSEAQKLLRYMIRADQIDNMRPSDVRLESPLFMEYSLKQFRDHLNHEKVRHWKKMHDDEYAKRVQFLKAKINLE